MGKREIFYEEDEMKEYTILAFVFVLIAVITDFTLMTKLLLNKSFWVFWAVMAVMIFVINGYLTWRPVVIYEEYFYLGIRIFTIPVEDFLFGFSLITLNISIWEYFTNKFRNTESKN